MEELLRKWGESVQRTGDVLTLRLQSGKQRQACLEEYGVIGFSFPWGFRPRYELVYPQEGGRCHIVEFPTCGGAWGVFHKEVEEVLHDLLEEAYPV